MRKAIPISSLFVVLGLMSIAAPATGQTAGGATNLQGLNNYNACMAQATGAQEKLTAQVLQRKLNSPSNLSAPDRQRLQEDIQWLNAKAANPRAPAPD
jgi:hypothetical protein